MLLAIINHIIGIIVLIIPIIAFVLGVSVVWAIWRMTWAHERIERHVRDIERLMESRASGGSA